MRYDRRATWVPVARLPRSVPRAVVAAEDARFHQHHGFDFVELRKARATAARRGLPARGASTLTQQPVKNLVFTTHRNWVRKGLELTITPRTRKPARMGSHAAVIQGTMVAMGW